MLSSPVTSLEQSLGPLPPPPRAQAAFRTSPVATDGLGPVAKTLLIPLWARAAETARRKPLVRDDKARAICDGLDFDFGAFRHAYGTQIGCVLRGLLYDRWVSEFFARHPHGTVVELGAGLGTRFERLDLGGGSGGSRGKWVDVDLPDVIALRRRMMTESPRRTFVAASAVDRAWVEPVRKIAAGGPCLFVSEGMLMYLDPADVRRVFGHVADAFGPTELLFDSIAPIVVRHQALHDSMRYMMDAPFRWGIDDVRTVESWDTRFRVRDVATLPEIARRFAPAVGRPRRAVGAFIERVLPWLASAYRLTRISFAG